MIMSFVAKMFSPPEPKPLPPLPEPPDINIKERRRRSRDTGLSSRIFTSPLGVQPDSDGKSLLGD